MSVFPSTETWTLRKPAVESAAGVVSSQHYLASRVGARVLAEGGNAVDAAVATGLAIGTVEPWMSGLGGGGYMLVYDNESARASVVDFGMVAPESLDPADYPIVAGTDSDLFSWPLVEEDRNVKGPLSIAVPGFAAGMALALERFGTRSWRQSIAPAVELAGEGLAVDWYATLKIAGNAADLSDFETSRETYLVDGLPPAADWASPLPHIRLGRLAATLERLAEHGAEDFYRGETATRLVRDVTALGGRLSLSDLERYQARICEVEPSAYRGAEVFAGPGLTAGPTLVHALELLTASLRSGDRPDADTYHAFAAALMEAYDFRLTHLGDIDESAAPSSTTHISVVDAKGNMVALTQTLLSVFGSRVMLPSSGILMNNGIMWFDPRGGRPNSLRPGGRPLSNMCPTIVRTQAGSSFALGASGGRRIMPAVFQLVSFLVDYEMSLEQAMHTPRIDYSGAGLVTANNALPNASIERLQQDFQVQAVVDSVYPSYFACPNLAGYDASRGTGLGAAFVTSPWAEAAPASSD